MILKFSLLLSFSQTSEYYIHLPIQHLHGCMINIYNATHSKVNYCFISYPSFVPSHSLLSFRKYQFSQLALLLKYTLGTISCLLYCYQPGPNHDQLLLVTVPSELSLLSPLVFSEQSNESDQKISVMSCHTPVQSPPLVSCLTQTKNPCTYLCLDPLYHLCPTCDRSETCFKIPLRSH